MMFGHARLITSKCVSCFSEKNRSAR